MRPAIFLDRDGVINENRSDHVKTWEEFKFERGVLPALAQLAQTEFAIVVITNQAAINRGIMTQAMVETINANMCTEIVAAGGRVDGVFFCPHRPDENCACRKPQPGLLLQAAAALQLDLAHSIMVGDKSSDIRAALNAGVRPIMVQTGHGEDDWEKLTAVERTNLVRVPNLAAAITHILAEKNAPV